MPSDATFAALRDILPDDIREGTIQAILDSGETDTTVPETATVTYLSTRRLFFTIKTHQTFMISTRTPSTPTQIFSLPINARLDFYRFHSFKAITDIIQNCILVYKPTPQNTPALKQYCKEMYEFNATAPPASQPGAEIDLAPILAVRQKWLLMESELGRTSSSKGQISLAATTSTRQFIPCRSLYLFQVRATLASVPKSADLIQLSLPVIFEKSSHSFGSGPWIASSEHSSSEVYRSCPDMTPRKPLAISG